MIGKRDEDGLALISVVSVLVLLAIIATPFLVTMRDSAARGERFLYSSQADIEAESLFELVRAHLSKSIEHVERRKLDDGGATGNSDSGPANDATPTSDTLDEFELPESLLQRFNNVQAREQRVWDVEIVDLQSRLNLNGCSYPVLANILGVATLADNLTSDDDRIPLSDASMFPPEGGVVRVGSEVIKYEQASGTELLGCERGYKSDRPENGGAGEWQTGDLVVLEAAFQIATRPFRARPGEYVRYTNPYQVRTIGEQGVTALSSGEFDRMRRFVTCWSGNVVGDGWSNPQVVRNAIGPGDASQLYAELKNVRFFGVGTVVRLTDGVNNDYAVVTKVRGSNQVLLAGNIQHDYDAGQARLYSLARAPVNVNTTDIRTLVHIFAGLHLRGKTPMTSDVAKRLAEFLKTFSVDEDSEPGVYRDWEQFVKALDEARQIAGILDDDSFAAVLLNAMNSNDAVLGFSTVPFTFQSFDTYEIRATASIMDQTGRELARREMRRVLVASSAKSATYVVETQDDFQDQIMKSRDGKWFATYPQNINAYYDGPNIPASEYRALAQKSRFPSTDRSEAVGHVALLPGAFRYTKRQVADRVHHFDSSDLPEGLDLDEQQFEVGVDGPYSVADRLADLVDFTDVENVGDDIELGMKQFALSFWYQPGWSRGEGDQVIFDYGVDQRLTNRVSLTYDDELDRLVLAVADATDEDQAMEVFYEFDHTTWDTETWYHIGVHVAGTRPSQIELFVDGEKQGRAYGISRLTTGVQGTGEVRELRLEDAEVFPTEGVVIVRSVNGAELFEYSAKNDNSLIVSRRKARSIDAATAEDETRAHDPGAVVELYGYAAPLVTDLREGGATITQPFGPFRVYRFNYVLDTLEDANNPARFIQGLAEPIGGSTMPITGITLTEWDTGSTSNDILDDLGGSSAEGYAMIVSNGATLTPTAGAGGGGGTAAMWRVRAGSTNGAGEQQSNDIGTTEIVKYRVSSTAGAIEITARHVELPHLLMQDLGADGFPRFIPTYSFGDTGTGGTPAATFGLAVKNAPNGTVPNGAYTAFIPISVNVSGGGDGKYLNPAEEEQQVSGVAYVQVDSEWVKYDTYDSQNRAFLRNLRLERVQNLFAQTFRPLDTDTVVVSAAMGGGRGATGGNSPEDFTPVAATDDNDESNLPTEPQATTGQFDDPLDEVSSYDIAVNFDFRGLELPNQDQVFRIANTIPNDHASGTPVIPTFRVAPGHSMDLTQDPSARGAYPGFNDLATLRDASLHDQHVRVKWGYKGWVGLTEQVSQRWNWDRPQRGETDLRRYDSRVWTRLLKFPSGELPDAGLTTASEALRFSRSFDDGISSSALIDEVFFPDFTSSGDTRPNYVYLGQVPGELIQQLNGTLPAGTEPADPRFEGIDDEQDEIEVRMPFYDTATTRVVIEGLPIDEDLFPDDGGVIKIDDEIILYAEFDSDNGTFSGCIRGTFGTQPADHQYGAVISPVHTFPASRLTSDADVSSASFQLVDTTDFPDDGYIRIADRGEIVGYTERDGNALSGPLGRIDPSEANERDDGEALVGGGLFRGRFGTTPEAYVTDDVAISMPFRYYDRYAERSDDPENSYVQLSWSRPGAIWKRLTWTEQPRSLVEVVALVRFAGGPAWDADKVIRVGQEPIPASDRRKWLYEITDQTAENLLNIESDRMEVRLMVRYAGLAYDRYADVAPDAWKQTPWIQKVVAEFVAPPVVIYEDK